MRQVKILFLLAIIWGIGAFESRSTFAQPETNQQDLQINLADKANLNLPALVEWLAEVKKLKITTSTSQFSANISNKVVFYGEVSVSPDAMLEFVQSILRTNGFALVKSDVGDFHQIVSLTNVRPFAPLISEGTAGDFPNSDYVTGVFPLKNVSPQEALTYIKQIVYGIDATEVATNLTILPNRNTLIITETAGRLARIQSLLKSIDIPAEATLREFYKLKHLQAIELQQQLNEILSLTMQRGTQESAQQGARAPNKADFKIDAIFRTNQLLISGNREQIDETLRIIAQLDVANELALRTYQFQFVAAKRIDELIRQSLRGMSDDQIEQLYRSTVNEQSNQLMATTRDEIHAHIVVLKKQLDAVSSVTDGQSPIRFYSLKNAKAVEVLDTLQSIVRRLDLNGERNNLQNNRLTGITHTGTNLGNQSPFPPNGINQNSPFLDQFDFDGQPVFPTDQSGVPNNAFGNPGFDSLAGSALGIGNSNNLIPGDAKLTVDENTNTLIVVAEPDVQKLYAELIARLDIRRTQVMIEVQVVIISGQNDLTFGVEVSGGDRIGLKRLFAFTSFGLSEVNAITGALTIKPGTGLNGTLVDPETADVVLRALSNHRRARVETAPRILVADNSTGLLSSVSEVPYAQVNASNTVATTSFGGFAQAGTTVSVTPQISDDDYVNLEFDVLLNNFTGTATTELPPPRDTDQVASDISIPNGHTVIVGGLTRRRLAKDLQGIPILERIPLLKLLSSLETNESADQRLFVFIKPTIIRDAKFRDLRFISELERKAACIPDDFPSSSPVLIR